MGLCVFYARARPVRWRRRARSPTLGHEEDATDPASGGGPGNRRRRGRGPPRRRRPRRPAAAHAGDAARSAERRPVRPHAERRHGLEPDAAQAAGVRHRQHDGRAARRGRHARSRSAITPGTGRSACSCAKRRRRCAPRARFRSRRTCSDPCDGRTQGTTGMFDSLAYRNDAAIVMRRLIRSLPTASGVMGIATLRQGAAGDDARAGRRREAARRSSCRAA